MYFCIKNCITGRKAYRGGNKLWFAIFQFHQIFGFRTFISAAAWLGGWLIASFSDGVSKVELCFKHKSDGRRWSWRWGEALASCKTYSTAAHELPSACCLPASGWVARCPARMCSHGISFQHCCIVFSQFVCHPKIANSHTKLAKY